MEYANSPETSKLMLKLSQPAKRYGAEKPVLPFKLVGNDKDHPRLIHILNRLCQSEWGYEQAKTACEAGFTLGFASTQGAIGVCDKAGSYITLNPHFSDDTLVGTLSHESRHAGQFARGGNEDFGVENIQSEIIKFRAMEADAEVSNVVATYELYQKGDKAPFLEYRQKSPYIARVFEEELHNQGGIVNNEVKTAAFKGWYDDNGIKNAYERGYHVHHMQQATQDGKADQYPYSKNITSEEEINRTCVDKNGCYFAGDKKVLASGKFLDVSPSTKSVFDRFFNLRKERYGIAMDPTLKNIPVRKESFYGFQKKRRIVTVDANKFASQRGGR